MRRIFPILALILFFAIGCNVHAQFGGSSGVTQSQLNAVSALIPVPTASVPVPPIGAGSTGTAGFYTPPDAAQKVVVQRTTVNTDANGNWSVTWNTSFVSSTPTINPIPLNTGSTTPYICNVTTRSVNAAAGKCWQVTSQTVGLISLTISLAPSNAPVSVPVMIIGAEPTQ